MTTQKPEEIAAKQAAIKSAMKPAIKGMAAGRGAQEFACGTIQHGIKLKKIRFKNLKVPMKILKISMEQKIYTGNVKF